MIISVYTSISQKRACLNLGALIHQSIWFYGKFKILYSTDFKISLLLKIIITLYVAN